VKARPAVFEFGGRIVAVIVKCLKPQEKIGGKPAPDDARRDVFGTAVPDQPAHKLPTTVAMIAGGHPRPQYVTVSGSDGQRIDNYLVRELRGVPKSRIYRMLRSGEVRVNGGRVRPTTRLVDGDTVRIPPLIGTGVPESTPQVVAPAPPIGRPLLARLEQCILFEDDDLIVINKPAGLAVHGGSGVAYGVIEALRVLRPQADLQLVHRLDRDTSGCLMVATRRSVLLTLHAALRDRTLRKRYDVLVHGAWPRRLATVQLPLEKYMLKSGERRVRVASDGKPSRTDFTVVESHARGTWLQARLHTGRTHQIRVHAAASGYPVMGDTKYATAGQQSEAAHAGVYRLCLHAREIVFEHRGARLRLEAPLPADFEAAWQVWCGNPAPD